MDETNAKKRGWVKNAAIVFLSVMLVLTFFSNTFMNRSLAEVATKYVVSGEITTKIRGSGTVAANETYEVALPQSRTVESVKIQVGDEVQEGDVLFTLDTADSQELKQAEDALRAANLAYQRALISATDQDYAKEDRDIQIAREELEAAQAELNSYTGSNGLTLQQAKSQMETAKSVMDACQKEVEKYQKQLSNLSPGGGGTSSLYSQYQAAEQTLSDARRALSAKLLSMGDTYKSLMKLVVDDRLENAAADSGVKEDLTELKRLYLEYEYEKFAGTSSSVSAAQKNLNDYVGKEENKNLKAVSERFVKEWEPQLNVYMDAAATDGYIGFSGEVKADEKQAAAYTALKKLIEDVSTAQRERDAAYSSYLDAMSSDDSGEYSRVNRLLQKAQESLDSATTSYEKAKNIYDGMSSATTAVKEKQRALEDLLFALDEQKKQDNKNIKLEALDLQEKRYAIADAQETVEQLREDATEPEVKAKVSGVIGSITVTAGKTAEAGTTICTIIVPDMGYNVSFSVTADQARKVRVGDEASIANYYGGDIKATLSNIRTDPQNPQTNRILTFDITGEVEAGTTLNLSVGQKSAQYDTIVPNSAIRSDSNGDFVLVVTSKSSPLGNRYVATRVDVEKIISDDTNTAVTGGLNAYDYVITTSSKPIKDKDLVRLAE